MLRFATPVLAAIVALLASPASAQEPAALTPEQIGQVFCIARIGNDMAPVEGLLTSELAAAIAEGLDKNEAIAAANPDEKPPLGDGIPWQSYPDYADKCTAGPSTYMMDEATVSIGYAFSDWPDAAFTDRLHLKLVEQPGRTDKVWRIDDIAYATEGDLRSALTSAFTN